MKPAIVCVCCGVCASGKSSVALQLQERFGCAYIDADDFHSKVAKEKMAQGIPLTDEDRFPWLCRVALAATTELGQMYARQAPVVALACSALTRRYRAILAKEITERSCGAGGIAVVFALLTAPAAVIQKRASQRQSGGRHFFNSSLVDSQLELLEGLDEDDRLNLTVDSSSEAANTPEKAACVVWSFVARIRDEKLNMQTLRSKQG